MTNCKNCDANCFSFVPDGCVEYTGEAVASLGINDNMSVKQVLQKLIGGYIALADKIAKCNLCNQEDYVEEINQPLISLAGLAKSSTSCAASLVNLNFNYTIIGGATSVGVQYSFQDIIDNIPTNYSIIKKGIKVWGANSNSTLYASSANNSGTFNVEPSRFPLTLDFSIQINTPCGVISVDKVVLLNGVSAGSYSTTGIVSDYGSENHGTVTQETFNQVLRDKVINLERDVNTIKNINLSNTGSIVLPSNQLETVLQTILLKLGEIQ